MSQSRILTLAISFDPRPRVRGDIDVIHIEAGIAEFRSTPPCEGRRGSSNVWESPEKDAAWRERGFLFGSEADHGLAQT